MTTRGYHGNMYDLWTIPEVSSIPESEVLKIATCVQQVEDHMKSLLCTPFDGPLEQARESTVGDTRVSTVMRRFSNLNMAIRASSRLYNDRKTSGQADYSRDETHDGGLMSKDIVEQPEIESRPISPGPAVDGHFATEEGECSVHGRPTDRPCSLCGLGRFCNQECPDGMYTWHLAKCCNREMTTADQLMYFVYEDLLPRHAYIDVRDDFGFNRCRTQNQESFLMGLY